MNRNNHPRLITYFKQIPHYQQQINIGLVHEIFVNIDHPEEYLGFIPNLCSDWIKAYITRYQAIFYFKIWSFWEERKYFKLFPLFKFGSYTTTNPILHMVLTRTTVKILFLKTKP